MRTTGGVVSDAGNGQAMALVDGFPAPSPPLEACPQSAEEARSGGGGRARTPREAADCWARRRYAADVEAVAAAKKLDRAAAFAQVAKDAAEWGGPARLFAPDDSARRETGQTFLVELRRVDGLAPKLMERYGVAAPGEAALDLRYEADLDAGSVRPLDAAAWKALDADAAAKAAPGAAAPVYRKP